MIIVTGGAGFIGSNLIKALNERGRDDILAVDNLANGEKFVNLVDCDIADYMDKVEFIEAVRSGETFGGNIDAIFHEGACSDTTEWDGVYMMENNYAYSRDLLHLCIETGAQYIYASSAAVYGGGSVFVEDPANEAPLNMYGYSKLQFDRYVRRHAQDTDIQVVGLRYFNVFGPREQHKGKMSSVAFHLNTQLGEGDTARLFEGCDGYEDGGQQRDFIYVGDVVDVNMWLLDHPAVSGIFNVGTGQCRSFKDVANAVIAWHKRGEVEYIPFPANLVGRYQSFTEANISNLREAGYAREFTSLEEGVSAYMDWLHRNDKA